MMYKREDFYVDSEYGYFIIFGNKVFNLSDVKNIYLRDEAMYVEMTDGSREYFDIVVNMCNIPLLLDFIRELKMFVHMSVLSVHSLFICYYSCLSCLI